MSPSFEQVTTELVELELSKLYWDSVRWEARNMIQYYETLLESDLDLGLQLSPELCKESFKKIFDVWVGCQSNADKTLAASLYEETCKGAFKHLNSAKEKHPHLFIRGITCSHCEAAIKANTYYQCGQGCKSPHFYTLTARTKEAVFHKCSDIPACSPPEHRAPYRLCSVCTSTVSFFEMEACDLEHLELVYHVQPGLADSSNLSAKLAKLENARLKSAGAENEPDEKIQEESLEARFAEIAVQASVEGTLPIDPRIFMRTVGLMVKGHFAPSGNFHLCLMFGPLIFESGLEKQLLIHYRINHGVRACPRPPPTFFADGGVGEPEDDWKKRSCPFFFQDRDTKQLGIGHRDFEVEPRPILASMKRVYGAAFSGYPESVQEEEHEAIQCLIREADRLGKFSRTKDTKERAAELGKSADALTNALKKCLGPEVRKHLSRIAKILFEKREENDWSIVANNCQRLVNRLLEGEDFEYMIPQLPKNLKEESFTWPRYLISFGNHIEGFGKSLYQPNGLITSYSQSMPTIDYDVVEYLGSTALPEKSPLSALGNNSDQPSPKVKEADIISRLADHLWQMPGDSLSLLQFHLLRPPHKYGGRGNRISDETAWNRHRFRVLTLLDILASFTGALGNSLYNVFKNNPDTLSKITLPPARVLGNVNANETLRIIDKLGPRWVFYEINNRVPNAMNTVVKDRWRPFRAARTSDDPVHGEQVVSRIVAWPLWIVSLISPELGAGIGGILRFHEHNWISTKLGERTYVRQYMFRKVRNVRE
ncbi:hypothetical protein QBC44DRAFT_245812 [Cladorrhinum sp. PSN332]|nr:hypothetical protein QBC44DRAFT_245812 [Cladorrhinum sp. PSN332]